MLMNLLPEMIPDTGADPRQAIILVSSLLTITAILVMFYAYLKTTWLVRCSMRREFLMLECVHEVSKAIQADEMELVAGALMEHFQRMNKELEWQNTHDYSVRHPLTFPEWPNYESLLRD